MEPRPRPTPSRWPTSLAKSACLAAAIGFATAAVAQQAASIAPALTATAPITQLISLPLLMPGKTQQQMVKHGLMLTIETFGAQGLGYRPLEVTFTALTPLPADRSLTIEFTTFHRWAVNEAVRVTERVELPAGASTGTATLRLPQFGGWDTFGVKVWEDGEQLEELSFERMGTGGQQYNEALPRVLVVGPASSDLSGLTAGLGGTQTNHPASGPPAPAPASLLTGDQLPDHWLDYTTFDVVVTSWDQLEALIHNHPPAWQALWRWVSAGGNLVVFKASGDWDWLHDFERDAQPPVISSGGRADQPPGDANARAGEQEHPPYVLRLDAHYAPPPVPGWQPVVSAAEVEAWSAQHRGSALAVLPRESLPQLDRLSRPWDLGQILVLRSDPLTPDPAIWTALWSQFGDDRTAAAPRLGLSALSANHDFWNLLVPNVGLPPVDAFRVLITLFVVLIGPVNYFLLRRLQRLHLLVFIVPAAALLVTVSLLAYAILGDGLGVKLRARTLTILDQPRGEGLCWSRLSYYAGLAPSGGLTFSKDTAVYPLEAQPSPMGRGQATRVVVWGERQNLTRGWLASRTPTQFVTVRAVPTKAMLAVSPADAGLTLENQLGSDLMHVVVADEQGRFFYARDLAAGNSNAASETPLVEALARLAPVISAARPEAPAEMSAYQSFPQQRGYGFSSFDSPWPDPRQETSRLEQAFELLSQADHLGLLPLGPRSYVALVRRSPLAEYGYEPVEESGEIHLILGRW
jgi:hypothetical protein